MAILAPVEQKQREPNVSKQFWTRDDAAAAAIVPADYDVEQFKRECERDRKFRVYPRVIEADDPRDEEQYFLEEQCPSQRNF